MFPRDDFKGSQEANLKPWAKGLPEEISREGSNSSHGNNLSIQGTSCGEQFYHTTFRLDSNFSNVSVKPFKQSTQDSQFWRVLVWFGLAGLLIGQSRRFTNFSLV